jgi:hypothetical protein
MKSIYTTNEITQQIIQWFVTYYRQIPQSYFYYRFPDNQWSWSQHKDNSDNYKYMVITAGTVNFSLSIHTEQFKFFTEGMRYGK